MIVGIVIAFKLFPTVNVDIAQTNNVSQSNNNTGGGHGDRKPAGGSIVPVLAIGAILIASVSAISQSAQSTAQVSAVSQQALTTQRDIVQAMPKPTAQPVTVQAPQGVTLGEIVVTVLTVVNLTVWGMAGVMFIRGKRTTRRKPIKAIAKPAQAQGITHPAFTQAQSVRRDDFNNPLGG